MDFADAFDVRLVEQTTASWEFWFGLLQEYVDENDNARVPDEYEVQGYKLGKWVGKQRAKWESLPDERRQRLLELPG